MFSYFNFKYLPGRQISFTKCIIVKNTTIDLGVRSGQSAPLKISTQETIYQIIALLRINYTFKRPLRGHEVHTRPCSHIISWFIEAERRSIYCNIWQQFFQLSGTSLLNEWCDVRFLCLRFN